jgi:hypothetical protein
VRFFSATFGAGVVATQRPITCPKRQLQPERYAPVCLRFYEFIKKRIDIIDNINILKKGEIYGKRLQEGI